MDPNKKDTIPAGSTPPEDLAEKGQGEAKKAQSGEAGKGEGTQGSLGKFEGKTPEEILKSYQELEKKLGAQGNELGLLKQQNQQLLELLASGKGAEGLQSGEQGQQKTEGPSLDQQLKEIARKVEDGEMDMSEAMALQADIIRRSTLEEAAQLIQQREQERQALEAIRAFQEQHPDFEELRQSGVLEEIKRSSPIEHDDFSAYWEFKARQLAAAQEEAAKAGFKEGLDQKAKVVEGMKPAETVLKGSGTEMKAPPQNRQFTDEERRAAMMEALRSVRNQQT